MTAYVDDNLFPKVLFVEGSAPATPASGDQVLYIPTSTHHLTRKDSSGTVVDLETLASGVASITGTANEIIASGSTGAITLSTPQAIGTGSSPTFASLAAGGLTGVTAATRYVGGLATGGTPGSGTFVTGDWLIGQNATLYVCTSGGSPGTWSAAGGAASLTSSTNYLGADVTMTSANTYYDGPTLTLSAGTYVLLGSVTVYHSATSNYYGAAKLWDGTTVISSGGYGVSAGASADASIVIPVMGIVTPTGSTTYKISAACTSTGATIKAASVYNGAGNNAGYLLALKVA